MPTKPNFPIYLGDGAYITENKYGEIVIYTYDGIDITNEVVFEDFGFVKYLNDILTRYVEWGNGPKDAD